MPVWFYQIPIYLALALIVLFSNVISLFGYWVSKRFLSRVDNKDVVTKIVWQTVLFFSTVFITFWIATNWGNLGQLKQTTTREASAIAQIYNDLNSLPKTEQVNLEAKLDSYLNSIIHDEYPSLANGQTSLRTNEDYSQFVTAVYNYQPESSMTAELQYNRTLQHLSEMSDYRQDRLSYLDGNLHGPLLLFFLTMVLTGCFWIGFVDTRSFWFTLFIIMSQNWIFGSSSWLILEMDKPFQGQFSVTSDPFIYIQRDIHMFHATDNTTQAVCNSQNTSQKN
jgi:ABC-type multidrug transport system fused ATPase/permease subunit